MSLKSLAAFNSATAGLKNSTRNLLSISQARRKREKESELFDLEKKTAQLKIEKLQASGQSSALETKILEEINKSIFNKKKQQLDGDIASVDMAEMQERQKLKSHAGTIKAVSQDQDVQNMLIGDDFLSEIDAKGLKITGNTKSGFGVGIKPPVNKAKFKPVLGDLENGGVFEEGQFQSFRSREEAEQYAKSKLGPDAFESFPEAIGSINKKFGPKVQDFPKEIRDLRQGFDYLVNEIGMSPEDAKKWLEENN